MMALLDSSGKAPLTQERSHDLQGSHTTDSYLLQWKRHVSFLPNVSEMCWWRWIKYQSAKKVLSTVCIESCRPTSKSNRHFFTFPTVAFFFVFFSSLELIWILQMQWSVFSVQEGSLPRRTNTQTGRHFLTSQVIQYSSKILKTHSRAQWRKAYQLGQSITHTPLHLIMEWSRPSTQHAASLSQVCCHINHLGSSQTKYENTEYHQIKVCFQLNWAHFPVCEARRWVLGSGWVCWVTTCLWSSMPRDLLNAAGFLGSY